MEQRVYDQVIFLHYESICNIRTIVKQMNFVDKIVSLHMNPAVNLAEGNPSIYSC